MREKGYKASRFDPLEARYHYTIANIERLLKNHDAAFYHYKVAVQRNPANGEYLQRLGLVFSEMGKYDKAAQLLQAGILYDTSNPERYKRYALWLLAGGKKEEGTLIMRQAIDREPQKTREYITLMVLNGLRDEAIFDALPKRVQPHLLFADYLSQIGEEDRAEHEYMNALQYMHNEDPVTPAYFYKVYRYYMGKGRYDDALRIMRQAIQFLPENVGIRLTTGRLYEKLGIPYRALEEYKKALDLDPENKDAKRSIDRLSRT
jgi:tetratricopeptide (TPR) repeat protein